MVQIGVIYPVSKLLTLMRFKDKETRGEKQNISDLSSSNIRNEIKIYTNGQGSRSIPFLMPIVQFKKLAFMHLIHVYNCVSIYCLQSEHLPVKY